MLHDARVRALANRNKLIMPLRGAAGLREELTRPVELPAIRAHKGTDCLWSHHLHVRRAVKAKAVRHGAVSGWCAEPDGAWWSRAPPQHRTAQGVC